MNGEWFYCLVHSTVEPVEGCPADMRLGPYRSREEAADALAHAQLRNDQWDNDPRFNDPADDDSEDADGTGSAFDAFRP